MIMNKDISLAIGAPVLVFAIATLGAVSVGCGGAHLSQLREAAAADLSCKPSKVHILNSGKTRDVEACGQRATYHWEDGDWRMIARSAPPGTPVQGGGPQPVMKSAPGVAPAQPAPVMTPTATPSQPPGTPSQPPPSSPPPGKQL
jgi:hypothetical protein